MWCGIKAELSAMIALLPGGKDGSLFHAFSFNSCFRMLKAYCLSFCGMYWTKNRLDFHHCLDFAQLLTNINRESETEKGGVFGQLGSSSKDAEMNSSDSSEPDLEVGNRGSFGRIGR